MSTLVLVSLIIFAVAIVLGLAAAAVQGLKAWRAFRAFRGTAEAAMRDTEALLAKLEARTAALPDSTARIERARGQLEESLANAKVIAGAATEVAMFVKSIRALVPTK